MCQWKTGPLVNLKSIELELSNGRPALAWAALLLCNEIQLETWPGVVARELECNLNAACHPGRDSDFFVGVLAFNLRSHIVSSAWMFLDRDLFLSTVYLQIGIVNNAKVRMFLDRTAYRIAEE